MIGTLAVLGGIVAAPFIAEARRLEMDDVARADAPGKFVTLSRGVTHYRFFGPEDGPLVVCVHGLTTPSYAFEAVAEKLVAAGKRVLVYDHYGRGYSDRPKATQDRAFFVSHLAELLDKLGVTEAFDLVGYSMGGWVVTAFAADHPERIKKLVLVTPAGMGHELGLTAKLVKLPLIGDWLFMAVYGQQHLKGTETERALVSEVDFVIDRQQRELNYKGFRRCVLASLRGALSATTQQDHQEIARSALDVTAVWGEIDDVIPLSCKETLSQWNDQVKHVVVPKVGHSVPYTDSQWVVDALTS